MTRLCAVVTLAVLWVVPAGLVAADNLKPNMLSPKEIADGWILLFDGQSPFGWMIEGDAKLAPVAGNDVLKVGTEGAVSTETSSEFCAFELSFQYTGTVRGVQLVMFNQNTDLPQPKDRGWMQGLVRSEIRDGKQVVSSAFWPVGDRPARAREMAPIDGPIRTHIGFKVPAGSAISLANVKLKPLAMQPLFNGKDLKGWNVVPGHQSKFTVTRKGELNIKNGGGEIQTEGQWADFILQLDVISNGDSLNSGIFFRALPGQFWQGYEAQIRNQWEKDDRTKPVDYGTGGIYNRQQSRKVVSNDREWFTYTVLANGNHIATWVNGYQTASYFDNDKDAESARKGRFLGKGAISLQGHDPTTDLSFRNIRIQELPTRK